MRLQVEHSIAGGSTSVRKIIFSGEGELPRIFPGDLLEIRGPGGPRLFSLASLNYAGRSAILVSAKGVLSRHLLRLDRGQHFEAVFISGDVFRPTLELEKTLCIATGTGIAPFLVHQSRRAWIVWGMKNPKQYSMVELPDAGVTCFYSETGGHVQDFFNGSHHPKLEDFNEVYLCGHSAMIADVTSLLIERGFPKEKIFSEVFFT